MDNLIEKAKWVRQQIFETTVSAQHGHIGGSLSCVEILLVLYYRVMKPEDKFILSKGQGAQALYAVLADKGFFLKEELKTFCQPNSRFEGHANRNISGVDVTTGSLGNGLGIGAGWVLADRLSNVNRKVYVLLGDGECYEGSIWEAAMFASTHNLVNLKVIVDRNRQCVLNYTEDITRLEPFCDKWRAFGWSPIEVDGHDIDALQGALLTEVDKPTVIIAHTIKGKGISFMEGVIKWHAGVPDRREEELARKELYGH